MHATVERAVRPIRWWAEAVPGDPLERNAWEQGKASVVDGAEQHPLYQYLLALVPAVFAAAFAADNGMARVGLAFAAGTAGYLLVPYLWALAVAVRAPAKQRNAARGALREERRAHRRTMTDAARLNRRLRLIELRTEARRHVRAWDHPTPRNAPWITLGPGLSDLRSWVAELSDLLPQEVDVDIQPVPEQVDTNEALKSEWERRLQVVERLLDHRHELWSV